MNEGIELRAATGNDAYEKGRVNEYLVRAVSDLSQNLSAKRVHRF
jgi:hypothetical protein